MQFKFLNYQFKPSLIGVLALIVCVPLFIKLGLWQYNKSIQRQQMQQGIERAQVALPVNLKSHLGSVAQLHAAKVSVTGQYETQYQILLDNQVENSEAGYHVITPFKIADTEQYVLINRGWIKGMPEHSQLPHIETPAGQMQITGIAWLPSDKIFTLEKVDEQPTSAWQIVWQNLDMKKYQTMAPIYVLPVIIKLDKSAQSGFVRNWQISADRAITNLSYAYQWFGFAAAAIAIFLYVSTNRIEHGKPSN